MSEQNGQDRPLPAPILTDHEYLFVIATELRGIRAALTALTATLNTPPPIGEVILREPEPKPRPRREDYAPKPAEPLSMVEPEPQSDPLSLVEVEPEQKPKPKIQRGEL